MSSDALSLPAARKLLSDLLLAGRAVFTRHALEEMNLDDITRADALAVLRGGVVRSCDLIRGSWRYRVEARDLCVVVTFRVDPAAVVVTAWRYGRR